jgi:hypothetical protein
MKHHHLELVVTADRVAAGDFDAQREFSSILYYVEKSVLFIKKIRDQTVAEFDKLRQDRQNIHVVRNGGR